MAGVDKTDQLEFSMFFLLFLLHPALCCQKVQHFCSIDERREHFLQTFIEMVQMLEI